MILIDIDEDLLLPRVKVDLGSIGLDKEVVIQFGITNFNNEKIFFTDSNGLEMQERIDNYQETYKYSSKDIEEDGVAINYYPVTSAISMRDKSSYSAKRVFTVINDHT